MLCYTYISCLVAVLFALFILALCMMVAYVSFFKVPCNFYCKHAFNWLTLHVEEMLGIINLDFDIAGQLLIIYSSFVEYLKKNVNIMRRQYFICL